MRKKIMILISAFVVFILLWTAWGYFSSRVEQADFAVVQKLKDYEIREYPAHIEAQTTVEKMQDEAMSEGFRIIAGYIFGGNTKKQSIAMTKPVVSQTGSSERIAMTAPVTAADSGNSQTISFGMPRAYTLETLPVPNDPRVKIVMVSAKKYAVLKFSWYRSDERIKIMKEKLLSALKRDGISAEGLTSYAGYNAPWTPPWMMHNEVLVELK